MDNYKVLDTNILLISAENLVELGADGSIIVLSEVVLDEIDTKKNVIGELGYQARQFARLMNEATVGNKFEQYDCDIVEFDLRGVKIYVATPKSYPAYDDTAISVINDRKIIYTASLFTGSVFLTNDVGCKIKALSLGIPTIDLKFVEKTEFEFTKTLDVPSSIFKTLHNQEIQLVDVEHKAMNYNYIFTCIDTEQVKLGYIVNGRVQVLGKDTENELRKQSINPKGGGQLQLSRALQDTTIDIIVAEGKAGTGKTLVAVSNGIRLVEKGVYDGIIYMRNSVNDLEKEEEIGYLSQPLYSKILTPTGWTTMGEVSIGDKVITPTGSIAKVATLSPITYKRTYKVTTDTGIVAYASGEHLWEVTYKGKKRVKTTLELMGDINKNNYRAKNSFLPQVAILEFAPNSKLPLDPYFVGYMIGDGIMSNNHLHVAIGDDDASESLANLRSAIKEFPEYTIKRSSPKNLAYTISKPKNGNVIRERFSDLGLCCTASNKFLPTLYKFAATADRIELLRGLVDSDGWVRQSTNSTNAYYSTSSMQLAEDVRDLARGLGCRASIKVDDTKKVGDVVGICGSLCTVNPPRIVVAISRLTFNPAKLNRKADKYQGTYNDAQPDRIVMIEENCVEEVRCIGLDDTDHLYLTDGLIPTHNSTNEAKYEVYLHPLYDSLDKIIRTKYPKKNNIKVEEYEESVLERIDAMKLKYNIQPMLTLGTRGRTFNRMYIIYDEGQNSSKSAFQKFLTRVGTDSKVVVCGSNRQIDHPYITKYNNGLSVLLNAMTETHETVKLYAVELTRVARGRVTEFGENIFEKAGRS